MITVSTNDELDNKRDGKKKIHKDLIIIRHHVTDV